MRIGVLLPIFALRSWALAFMSCHGMALDALALAQWQSAKSV